MADLAHKQQFNQFHANLRENIQNPHPKLVFLHKKVLGLETTVIKPIKYFFGRTNSSLLTPEQKSDPTFQFLRQEALKFMKDRQAFMEEENTIFGATRFMQSIKLSLQTIFYNNYWIEILRMKRQQNLYVLKLTNGVYLMITHFQLNYI